MMRGDIFFTTTAIVLLLFSILCRFITGVTLKKLAGEAENMSATNNRILKQCKVKFQSYYELNGGMMNVGVFVDKFIRSIRLGRWNLRMLNRLSGQLLMLSVFCCGLGACMGIARGDGAGRVLPYYLLALVTLYLYFSVSNLADVDGRQQELKTNIADFLENRMTERIRSVRQDSEYLDAEERRLRKAEAKKRDERTPGELETLLEEFLDEFLA